jgi:hypothetical protein
LNHRFLPPDRQLYLSQPLTTSRGISNPISS